MKLLELIPSLKDYTRIKRKGWNFFLVKSLKYQSLIKIDLFSIQIGEYMLTLEDLESDDWEVINE